MSRGWDRASDLIPGRFTVYQGNVVNPFSVRIAHKIIALAEKQI